jgi:cytochrome c-type biogenesis protein
MTPTLPLAFAAGVLSFLSPCVLPLVPSYLAYVGGVHARDGARWAILSRSLLFVLGFSLVFVALGASASALGSFLGAYRYELARLGGLIILVFGLFMLGLPLPWLQRDVRFRFRGETRTPVGAMILGMTFAAGWTPCIGPVLGAALTVASTSGTLGLGTTLLAFYALGLAVPFVLAALMLESFGRFSARFRRYLPWVERASGAVLVAAGVLMLTGSYTALNSYLVQFTPDWLWGRL